MVLARKAFDATDEAGNLLSNVQVRVELEDDGGLVPVYSDRDGIDPLGNPFTAADGRVAFHAADGAYKITLTAGAHNRVMRYVGISLSQESAGGGGGGGEPADGSVTEAKLSPSLRNKLVTRTAALVTAMRTKFGTGAVADGTGYVDMLFDRRSLNLVASDNWRFAAGGIEPDTIDGTPVTAASATLSSDNGNWNGNTIVIRISAASISQTGKRVRVRFSAASNENLHVRGAVIGHAQVNGGMELDRAKEPTPLWFDTNKDIGWEKDITQNTSVWAYADFDLQAGRDVLICYYIAPNTAKDGLRYVGSFTGWAGFYKSSVNEPAKYAKTGYTAAGVFAIDRLEVVPIVRENAVVVSGELKTGTAPGICNAVVLAAIADADLSNLALNLSRDGTTWKNAPLVAAYKVDGQVVLAANGVDLSSGAGSGNRVFWRITTTNNIAMLLAGVGIVTTDDACVFTETPSVRIEAKTPVVTHHFEATGLGHKDGSLLRYGRLWGFTQDFEVNGPTRFDIRFKAGLEMLGLAFPNPATHPVTTTPVMFVIAITTRFAVDAAAMGSKPLVVTDSPTWLGDNFNAWLAPSAAGNIYGTNEHYKNAHIVTSHDILVPGYYRFEVWGYSETDADPGVGGRIAINHDEVFARSTNKRGAKPARLEITPAVIR